MEYFHNLCSLNNIKEFYLRPKTKTFQLLNYKRKLHNFPANLNILCKEKKKMKNVREREEKAKGKKNNGRRVFRIH